MQQLFLKTSEWIRN